VTDKSFIDMSKYDLTDENKAEMAEIERRRRDANKVPVLVLGPRPECGLTRAGMQEEEHEQETETKSVPKYPMHRLLQARSDKRDVIQEFLDWLDQEPEKHPDKNGEPREWVIAYLPGFPDTDNIYEVPYSKADIIAMFLGIDQEKLEQEKRDMLREMRLLADMREDGGRKWDKKVRTDGMCEEPGDES